MAHYLVRARPKRHKLESLKIKLEQGSIKELKPFGKTLTHSLLNAKLQPDGFAIWEEEDYCSPPLAQERAAILDQFFTELSVSPVSKDAGWQKIKELPGLWQE